MDDRVTDESGSVDPAVAAVLDAVAGDREVAERTALPSESFNAVYRLAFADGSTDEVVKTCLDSDRYDRLRRDAAVQRYLHAETDLPVPTPLDHDLTAETAPRPFVTSECHEGAWLDPQYDSLPTEGREKVVYEAGALLAEVHDATEFETAGRVAGTDDGRVELVDEGDWTEVFLDIVESKVADLRGTRFDRAAEVARQYVREHSSALDRVSDPTLLHGEFGPDNLLSTDGELTCVLDWEMAVVGHPEYDVCWAESKFLDNADDVADDTLRDALFAGYRSRADLAEGFYERREVYRVALVLFTMASFDSWVGEAPVEPDVMESVLKQDLKDRMS